LDSKFLYFANTHFKKNSEDSVGGFEPLNPLWVHQWDWGKKGGVHSPEQSSLAIVVDC